MNLFSKPDIPEGFSSSGKVKPIAIDWAFPKKGIATLVISSHLLRLPDKYVLIYRFVLVGWLFLGIREFLKVPKNAYRKSLKTGPFPKPWVSWKRKRVQVVKVLARIGNLTTKDTENLVLFSMQRET